jgi:hypothetical protein
MKSIFGFLRYRKNIFAVAALALTACASCGLDSKMALIKPGMKITQVEALLGTPTHIDETQTADQTLSGKVYHYSTPAGEGRVVFVNGSVFSSTILNGAKS